MKTIMLISIIGLPVLYGIGRMYYRDLARMFTPDQRRKINRS